MKNTTYIFILSFLCLTLACNRPKNKTTTVSKKNYPTISDSVYNSNPKILALLQNIYNNELPFEFLAAKMKTKAQMGNINQSFNTQLRWQKNNNIWMSMSIFGFEGARVLIKPDSVFIIDRLNKRNIVQPLSFIQEKTQANLSFRDIEKILLGLPFLVDVSTLQLDETQANTTLKAVNARFTTIITLNSQNLIQSIQINDKIMHQNIISLYDDYRTINNKQFAYKRNLKIVSQNNTFAMEVDFQNIDILKTLDFPFELNEKYSFE